MMSTDARTTFISSLPKIPICGIFAQNRGVADTKRAADSASRALNKRLSIGIPTASTFASPESARAKGRNDRTRNRPMDYRLRVLWYFLSTDLWNYRLAGARRMATGGLWIPRVQERLRTISDSGHCSNRQRWWVDGWLSSRADVEWFYRSALWAMAFD